MSIAAPTAKSFILDMLLAAEGRPLSVRDAILACSVFSISENSVRVALARLSSASMVAAAGRGEARASPARRPGTDCGRIDTAVGLP